MNYFKDDISFSYKRHGKQASRQSNLLLAALFSSQIGIINLCGKIQNKIYCIFKNCIYLWVAHKRLTNEDKFYYSSILDCNKITNMTTACKF